MAPGTDSQHQDRLVIDPNRGVGSITNKQKLPSPPAFADKFEEREYAKFRLAQAFRIFGSFSNRLPPDELV